jgi:hypothetical protein
MKKDNRSGLTWPLLAAGLCMCIYGAATGQAQDIFIKAVRICLECIGIG